MPIRKKNSPNWHYDFQIAGRRFCGSCETADFAEAKQVEARARVDAGRPDAPAEAVAAAFTLSQALGTYWTDVAQHQTSKGPALSQGKNIMAVFPEPLLLVAMTQAHLIRFVTQRRNKGAANGTINRELQLLGRSIRHMENHGAAKVGIDFRKAQLKEAKERTKELSHDQQDRLFANLRLDLHPFVKFALLTGARRSSITELKWTSVDLVNGKIRFDTKGEAEQHFPIGKEMRAFLSGLPRAEALPDAAYVLTFVDEMTGKRRKINQGGGSVHRSFHLATVAAGIEDFRFHDLRHTFATRMLRGTRNLKVVQKLLGHSSVETTTRYAHVLDEDLRDAMNGFSISRPAKSRKNPAA